MSKEHLSGEDTHTPLCGDETVTSFSSDKMLYLRYSITSLPDCAEGIFKVCFALDS